ncbi:hypothetical protein BMETH_996_1 [methanotrophic bacterial endosymbiont of Bathymodiolus sp.]|nr:hypothetical protein BMETH_996_1 [methanotrophic bacterial endosymbiont of Bathymodiolus sp.]
MGVFPLSGSCCTSTPGLPHARGGVSISCPLEVLLYPSSPRPWGCFPSP